MKKMATIKLADFPVLCKLECNIRKVNHTIVFYDVADASLPNTLASINYRKHEIHLGIVTVESESDLAEALFSLLARQIARLLNRMDFDNSITMLQSPDLFNKWRLYDESITNKIGEALFYAYMIFKNIPIPVKEADVRNEARLGVGSKKHEREVN